MDIKRCGEPCPLIVRFKQRFRTTVSQQGIADFQKASVAVFRQVNLLEELAGIGVIPSAESHIIFILITTRSQNATLYFSSFQSSSP